MMLELGQPPAPLSFLSRWYIKNKKTVDQNWHPVSLPHLQADTYSLHWWLEDGRLSEMSASKVMWPGQVEVRPSLRRQVAEFDDWSEDSCCVSDGQRPRRLAQIIEYNRLAQNSGSQLLKYCEISKLNVLRDVLKCLVGGTAAVSRG